MHWARCCACTGKPLGMLLMANSRQLNSSASPSGAVVRPRLHTWALCCTMHTVWDRFVSLTCNCVM